MRFVFLSYLLSAATAFSASLPSPETLGAAFGKTRGTLVLLGEGAKEKSVFDPKLAATPFAPCSTFKIWNTLIGVDSGIVSSADEAFYQWDGTRRDIAAWNQDLTLKEAFQASCVPAYQILARKIGVERMQAALDSIGYGDRNIAAGIDVFWLPAPGRKSLLITPLAQAGLMRRLMTGDVPFSAKARGVVQEIMTARTTPRGTLYGKTGTGGDATDDSRIGWYVGFVTSRGKSLAFACLVQGRGLMGKDARAIVEAVLEKAGWLGPESDLQSSR